MNASKACAHRFGLRDGGDVADEVSEDVPHGASTLSVWCHAAVCQ